MVVAGVKTGVAREFFTRDQLSNDVKAMAAEFQAQSNMEKQTRVTREVPSLSPVPVCTPNTFKVLFTSRYPQNARPEQKTRQTTFCSKTVFDASWEVGVTQRISIPQLATGRCSPANHSKSALNRATTASAVARFVASGIL